MGWSRRITLVFCEGFASQWQPVLIRVRVQAQPLPHRRALVRVEPIPLAVFDQSADPMLWELEHELSAYEHHEDLAVEPDRRPPEAASSVRWGDAWLASQFIDEFLVSFALREVIG